jgi:hypothetical protein
LCTPFEELIKSLTGIILRVGAQQVENYCSQSRVCWGRSNDWVVAMKQKTGAAKFNVATDQRTIKCDSSIRMTICIESPAHC